MDITISEPEWDGDLIDAIVTARGVLTNGTSVPVTVVGDSIPTFKGIDERGQMIIIAVYGAYDWTPPPGKPSPGQFVLQPGESVGWTAVEESRPDYVRDVRYWYAANESGSTIVYLPDEYLLHCSTPVQGAGSGKAIPNTFTG